MTNVEAIPGVPDEALDELASIAATACHAPMAMVNVVDETAHAFVGRAGIPSARVRRAGWFCEQTLAGSEILVVPDARVDARFASHPLVVGEPRVRFYAGAPLLGADGLALGTIAVLDVKPRELDPMHRLVLRQLAAHVVRHLEARRAEAASRRRHDAERAVTRELDEMFEDAPVGYYSIDPDGVVQRINRTMLAWLGYTGREIVHRMRIAELLYLDDRPNFAPSFARLQAEGTMTRDVTFRRKDGTPLNGVLHARASYDDDGRFVSCRSVVLEKSARRRSEPEPRAPSAGETDEARVDPVSRRINSILESMADGFVLLDRGWRYTYVNRRAGELLGRPAEQLTGKHIWTEFPEVIGQDFQRAYERAMREQVPSTIESYYPPWDRWFENRIYPWPEGIAIFFQEVTERKRAEEQLRGNVAQLRALSARLQLVRDEENARIARELHDDMGQALTALRMDLATLQRKMPETAERAAEMTALVDTLIRSVRRVSTELRPAVLEDLGLAAGVEWAAHEFAKRSGVTTTVDAPPRERAIPRAVSNALFRVLQEALTNVARHARARHVEVRLDASSDRAQLVVRDDGVGIPEAAIAEPRSIGLLGMRERMATIGGDVAFERAPTGGTIVRASAPLA